MLTNKNENIKIIILFRLLTVLNSYLNYEIKQIIYMSNNIESIFEEWPSSNSCLFNSGLSKISNKAIKSSE